jgi:hypothetical protein
VTATAAAIAAIARRRRRVRRASIPLLCSGAREILTGPNDQALQPDRLAVLNAALSAERWAPTATAGAQSDYYG